MILFLDESKEQVTITQEQVLSFYCEWLDYIRLTGFEPTPAEAVFVRQIILDCFNETKNLEEKQTKKRHLDQIDMLPEVTLRFYLYYFGVDLLQILKWTSREEWLATRKSLNDYLQGTRRDENEMF